MERLRLRALVLAEYLLGITLRANAHVSVAIGTHDGVNPTLSRSLCRLTMAHEALWIAVAIELTELRATRNRRANHRRSFRSIELLVPKRICDEDIGDALEVVSQLEAEGAPRWQIRLKCLSTCFWVGVCAVREVASALLGKKVGK